MAEDMLLYWGAGSTPCWRVMIALHEKNLQGYDEKMLFFEKGEHKSEKVMEINPRGQLPSFKHGDRILNESYAACMYLETMFKGQGNKLIPDNPDEVALMYQRMMEGIPLGQKMADVIYFNWKVPEGERHASALQRNKEALTTELKLWEKYLIKAPDAYLAGKNFTLADVLVYPSIYCLFHNGLSEERYPKIAAYYKSLKDRKSISDTWTSIYKEKAAQDLLLDI